MAEGVGTIQQNLLVEITCPLCLGIYQEPKRLPCDHVYCKGCLEGLAKHSHNGTITCPECRNVAQVPNNDVAIFSTAFQTNRLKELYEKQKQEVKCQLHGQPFALYCETCDELICRDCLIAIDTHKTHEYAYIAESAKKHRKHIEEELKSKQHLEISLSTALAKVTETKTATLAQEEVLEEEIDTLFQQLSNKLCEEKHHFKRKVNDVMGHKTKQLAIQENSLQNTQAELTESLRLAKQASQQFSDMQLVSEQKKIIRKLQCMVKKIGRLSLEPVEVPNIGCRTMTPDELKSACRPLHTMFTLADPRKCQAEGEGLQYTETDKQTTVVLHLADINGETSIDRPSIEVQVTNIKYGTSIMGSVAPKHRGYHEITYTAPKRGRHTLSIKVNGCHIAGSPFSVYVKKPPQTFTDPVNSLSEVKHPGGLSWKNDKLYVCEHNAHRVLIFDHTLKLVQTIEHEEMKSPTELTVDNALNVYVSTCVQNTIHKFNKDGEHMKLVRGFGFANGIRMSRQNEVYMCDTKNSMIYDADLNFRRSFQLRSEPFDIEFDKSGKIYITHANSHQIQVLSPDGRPINHTGKQGSKPGELNRPISLQVAGDLLYVTEVNNNRVSVFRTSGEFVSLLGEQYLSQPEGIAIDEDGYVYVTSHRQHVLVF